MTITAETTPLATILRLNAESVYPMELYQDHGTVDRFGYLADLANNQGIDFETLETILSFLPATEDFDGLVTTLEDYACFN